MKLELKVFPCLCSTDVFKINDIVANSNDFGEQYDIEHETADDYCCGNMVFVGHPVDENILKRYKITQEEYQDIVRELENSLSFGSCGWCS